MPEKFGIVQIKPAKYVHAAAFDEIAYGLMAGLLELGHKALHQTNAIVPDGRNIVLGAHLLHKSALESLPKDTIIYNFEQLSRDGWFMNSAYQHALSSFEVWDYSEKNIEYLKALDEPVNVKHVPIGYAKALSNIPKQSKQDIDVLFYGSMNDRRNKIIKDLKAAGMRVSVLTGVYGAQRDAAIARAKVVLNMHFYETQIFEIARVSYLLANKKAVVSEVNPETHIDPELVECVKFAEYDALVEACKEIVSDEEKRHALEQAGFEGFSGLKQSDFLAQVLH